MPGAAAEIGVIGGSGFYRFLDHLEEVAVQTPYGAPSARLAVGDLDGRRVAFLARHGVQHEVPAHRVNYRANLWALRSLGVRRVFGPCSVGSLQPGLKPGEFVVCDQLVDRTRGRADTYFDGPILNHLPFADPYCERLSRTVAAADPSVRVGGTMVVVEGPRFSTRAESQWFAAQGWSVVNMTGHPEAVLARELQLCYTSIALITDYDVGVPGVAAVTADEVFRVFSSNNARLRDLLDRLIPSLPAVRSCGCGSALTGADFSG